MSGGAHGHRGGGGRAVPPEHSVLVDSAALSVLAKEPLSSQDFRLLIEYGAGRLGCYQFGDHSEASEAVGWLP